MAIVTKTYIDKSNTIYKDSCANNGLNPILELNYGNLLSRGLIYFDHTKLKHLYEDKTYPDMSKMKHTLRMFNTNSITPIVTHSHCKNEYHPETRERATSFDLIFFLINKEWDMGKGFDYIKDLHIGSHMSYSEMSCNWYRRMNYFQWENEGIYTTRQLSLEMDKFTSKEGNQSLIIIGRQHFDYGNEDICLDITDVVNKYILGNLDNYGIGVAFSPNYENMETPLTQYVGFFTQHTHSFFSPYVETTYDDRIEDDRNYFYLDKDNKLYFYSIVGGQYVNLDKVPSCSINGSTYDVKQATKGIYYIDVNLSSEEHEEDTMLYDTWSNISYNGKEIKDVELSFVTKPSEKYFSFGKTNDRDNTKLVPTLYGINNKERIKQGDIRMVNVDCRVPYTTAQIRPANQIDYRVYVDEGEKQRDVIGWTQVERGTSEIYFLINTAEFIPHRYFIDVRVHTKLELIQHTKLLEFDIVNEAVENCNYE